MALCCCGYFKDIDCLTYAGRHWMSFVRNLFVITVEDLLAEWDLESEILICYMDDERGVILGSILNAPLMFLIGARGAMSSYVAMVAESLARDNIIFYPLRQVVSGSRLHGMSRTSQACVSYPQFLLASAPK